MVISHYLALLSYLLLSVLSLKEVLHVRNVFPARFIFFGDLLLYNFQTEGNLICLATELFVFALIPCQNPIFFSESRSATSPNTRVTVTPSASFLTFGVKGKENCNLNRFSEVFSSFALFLAVQRQGWSSKIKSGQHEHPIFTTSESVCCFMRLTRC